MKSLAEVSIRNPVFAWMLMAFLVVFGAISFSRLGVSQLPDIDFPNVSVSLAWEGAGPEIMETDVVDIVEDAVMSVEGIREVTATCRHGRASVNIEFDLSRDIDAAVQEVQTKLAQAQRLLPRDMDPPIVSKQNPEDNPILWFGLSGDVELKDLTTYARDHLKDRFQTVPGVGEVTMGGFLDRNLRVWLLLDEMETRQIAVDDVLAALSREHVEVPAGRIESGDREMNVRAVGEAPTVAEFKRILVAYRNNAPVYLHQIADIQDGLEDRRRVARAAGAPAVGFGVKKQRGANAVAVAKACKAKMVELRKDLPEGMSLNVNFDSTTFVEESIHEIEFNLALSVALTSLVCLLFLGSWSSTFNILLSIPTSIVGSFILIYFLGFTLNTFTLLSLSLAIGIVVDDAIMVLENIVRHREMGKGRVQAASTGAREITFAAMATTFALVAIFLPIAFMQGIIGKFLYQFGVTMSVAVSLSLVEALTLTPMRASQMLEEHGRTSRFGLLMDRFFHGLAGRYRGLLGVALRHRAAVLLAALGVCIGTVWLGSRIPGEPLPRQDAGRFMIRMQTPVGSSLDYTEGKLMEVERVLASRPEVNRYFGMVGGFGGGEVDTAMMFVTMKPKKERGIVPPATEPASMHQVIDQLRGRLNAIPGLRAFPNDMSLSALGIRGQSNPIEFVVTGDDWGKLAESAREIMEKMGDEKIGETRMLTDVNSNYLVGMPEVRILPNRERAAALGVNMQTIGTTVNALVGGVRAAKFTEGGHRFDVRLRLRSDWRSRPDDVKRLFVRNRSGQLVRLSEVVDLKEQATIQTITRRDRQRAITITAGMAPGVSQGAAMDRVRAIAASTLPDGYGMQFTGGSRLFTEGAWSFLLAIVLGLVIAYMILASQFNSFVQPVLVILAMPFSITGAIVAMLLAGVSFNLYSAIGFVLLMGIVKKNSILLVDFTNQVRARGKPVLEALREACPIRLRPILMTCVTTIAAATPPAFAAGAGLESVRAMAVVVVGGVAFSTLLTLFVVPCAYAVMPGRVQVAEDLERELAGGESPGAQPADRPVSSATS